MKVSLRIFILFFVQIVFSQTRQDTLSHSFSISEIQALTKTQFLISVSDEEPSFVIDDDLVLPKGVKLYLFPDSIPSGKNGKLNVYVNRKIVTEDVLSILLHNKNNEDHTILIELVFVKEESDDQFVIPVRLDGQLIDKESNRKLLGKVSIINLETNEKVAFWTGMEGGFRTASLSGHADYLICVAAPQCKLIFDTLRRKDHIEEVLTRTYLLERFHEGDVVPLDHILFKVGEATIMSSSLVMLDGLVMMMKLDPEMKVRIDGHTDNSASQSQAENLSKRRAESVRKYLEEHQISVKRVDVRGVGFTEPLVPNTTEHNREMNRRVEFVVLQL